MNRPSPVRSGIVPALVDAPFTNRDEHEGPAATMAVFLGCLPAMFIIVFIAGAWFGSVIA